jgi:peptide/nickel transport system permease protein
MGLPLGIYAATHRNTAGDRLSVVGAVIWSAAPSFWTSLLLIYFVAYKLGVFPVFGAGYGAGVLSVLYHLILPTFALGTRSAGDIARMSRASILEIMNFDYVKTAEAKGLSHNKVLYRHVVRNAAIPLVTIIGMNTAIDLGAAVIIESVFARPGMGRLMADAIFARDYPVVQGCALVFAGFTAGINLLTDLSYTLIDPRVRHS